jgi:hypothetical protein
VNFNSRRKRFESSRPEAPRPSFGHLAPAEIPGAQKKELWASSRTILSLRRHHFKRAGTMPVGRHPLSSLPFLGLPLNRDNYPLRGR